MWVCVEGGGVLKVVVVVGVSSTVFGSEEVCRTTEGAESEVWFPGLVGP